MKFCEKCGSDSRVYESRFTESGNVIRRRICQKCKRKWMTIEVDYFDYLQLKRKEGD